MRLRQFKADEADLELVVDCLLQAHAVVALVHLGFEQGWPAQFVPQPSPVGEFYIFVEAELPASNDDRAGVAASQPGIHLELG